MSSCGSGSSGDSGGSCRSTRPGSASHSASSSPHSSPHSHGRSRNDDDVPPGGMFAMDRFERSTSSSVNTATSSTLPLARQSDYATNTQGNRSNSRRPPQATLLGGAYTSPSTQYRASASAHPFPSASRSGSTSHARIPSDEIQAGLASPQPAAPPGTSATYHGGSDYPVQGRLSTHASLYPPTGTHGHGQSVTPGVYYGNGVGPQRQSAPVQHQYQRPSQQPQPQPQPQAHSTTAEQCQYNNGYCQPHSRANSGSSAAGQSASGSQQGASSSSRRNGLYSNRDHGWDARRDGRR